jgi:hypothetical protein
MFFTVSVLFMPIHTDYLSMATPVIGMIRLARLQFLLNFAAIDGLHLRETGTAKEAFRPLRIPHRETGRTILIVHPESLTSTHFTFDER